MMNCGYDPAPGGTYDLPPIAPQMWHAYHIAGEQLAFAIVAALLYRWRTGKGQHVSCAIHEAVAKSTEVDLMTWVMRRALVLRQTCRHARESVTPHPVHRAHQGRPLGDGEPRHAPGRGRAARRAPRALRHGGRPRRREAEPCRRADGSCPAPGRARPGATTAWRPCSASCARSPTRTCRGARRRKPGCSGRRCASRTRTRSIRTGSRAGAVTDVEHPELGRSFRYATSKWLATANVLGGRAAARRC